MPIRFIEKRSTAVPSAASRSIIDCSATAGLRHSRAPKHLWESAAGKLPIFRCLRAWLLLTGTLASFLGGGSEQKIFGASSNTAAEVTHESESLPEGPWRIHFVRISRHSHSFEVHSMHAGRAAVGLATLS